MSATTTATRARRTPISRPSQSRGVTRGGGGANGSLGVPTSQMSGFVTEAFSWRHRETSNVSRERDSDEETTLADVEAPRVHNDPIAVGQKLYKQTCEQLHVVPISLVLRHIGESEHHLRLSNRNCGPDGAKALAAPLMINRHITHLDLSDNDIQDAGIVHILSVLTENTHIRDLNLSRNNFTTQSIKMICKSIGANSTLLSLDLSGNAFKDCHGCYFERLIQDNKSLKTLKLSNTGFGIDTGLHIGRAIGSNESLNNLDLSWNHIRLKGAQAIAKGLKENITVHRMNLSWNGFSGKDDALSLLSLLQENSTLEHLDISGNRLTDKDVVMMAQGLIKNEAIQVLKMSNNQFSHVGAYALLKAYEQSTVTVLRTLCMKDVTVGRDFVTMYDQLTRIQNRSLSATYRSFPVRQHPAGTHALRKNQAYLQRAVTFLVKIEKPLKELFPTVTEDSQDTCATREEFIDTLTSIGMSLSSDQLDSLATHLENDDRGLLDLSSMFALEKTMLEEEEEPENNNEEEEAAIEETKTQQDQLENENNQEMTSNGLESDEKHKDNGVATSKNDNGDELNDE